MRKKLQGLDTPDHVGLAYTAWAPVSAETGKIADNQLTDWLKKLAEISISEDYAHYFERWRASFTSPDDRLGELELSSRLLIGHGNASASDVGLTVDHTWGVPIIPGSALKGLTAHYVEATYGPNAPDLPPWEQLDEERLRADYQGVTWENGRMLRGPGAVYRALFGAPDTRGDEQMRELGFEAGATSGLVTFHDALYVPGSAADTKSAADYPFAPDVLTVHHKEYYNTRGANFPNDYDSPNPVSFLTVRPGCRLQLVISGPNGWADLAARLLADALTQWGIGAKTAAGYGVGSVERWSTPNPPLSAVVSEFEAWTAQIPPDMTQKSLLDLIRKEWLPRFSSCSDHDKQSVASWMKNKFNSKKRKEELAELLKQLMG